MNIHPFQPSAASVTFYELRKKYTQVELSGFPGNNELRFEIFPPFFDQLYENKVVYLEKFICIVKLTDIQITPKGFHANATPVLQIERNAGFPTPVPRRPWDFGSSWSWMSLWRNSFSVPYANWTIWPEPARVKAVEDAVLKGDHQLALNLTLYEPEC